MKRIIRSSVASKGERRAEAPRRYLRLLPSSAPAAAEEARASLMDAIHQEIIPKLILVDAAEASGPALTERGLPLDAHVATLARLAADGEPAAVMASVDELLDGGLATETLLVRVVAPAARRLGAEWDRGEWTFDEVQRGLRLLEAVVTLLGDLIDAET